MFHRILVPLDGSSLAEQALPVATRIAQASNAMITVLRAVVLPIESGMYPTADPWTIQTVVDADIEEAKDYLQDVTRLNILKGIHVETEMTVGTAADAILSMVEQRQIDLVVLCSHGYTGMKRWVLGSVAEKVAHHATVPVLLLREGGPALIGTPPHAEGPLRALIPLDGSARAETAIIPAAELIAALASPGPGALHLTQVVVLPDEGRISPHERDAIIDKTKQYLSTTVERTRERLVASAIANCKFSITWSVAIHDDIATGIIRTAEEDMEDVGGDGNSDIIAMTTHGYSGLRRWTMGSISERVLRATRLPLLIVRPTDMTNKDQQAQNKATAAV